MRLTLLAALATMPFLATMALAGPSAPPPPTSIPEPASLALLAVGAGAILLARARRK